MSDVLDRCKQLKCISVLHCCLDSLHGTRQGHETTTPMKTDLYLGGVSYVSGVVLD